MFGIKRIVVAQHERGLYLKDRSLVNILGPGVYWMADPFRSTPQTKTDRRRLAGGQVWQGRSIALTFCARKGCSIICFQL